MNKLTSIFINGPQRGVGGISILQKKTTAAQSLLVCAGYISWQLLLQRLYLCYLATFCILYSVFCILYSVFCILYSVFCIRQRNVELEALHQAELRRWGEEKKQQERKIEDLEWTISQQDSDSE